MRLRPFWPRESEPDIRYMWVMDYGTSKLVGKDNVHLKLEMIDKTTSIPVNGIAFRQSDSYERVKSGEPFDICYTLEENTHNGKTNIQLYVKDIDTGQLC